MSKLVWDQTGERIYETGVSKGVLFVVGDDGKYGNGVAWNGLTAVTKSPSGAEATPLYADDIKYLNLMSAESFGATIEAYTYPEEFRACNGSAAIAKGVYAGQQKRKMFGMCFKTLIGNDVDGTDKGYKLHFIYGAQASPSEEAYATVNGDPEAITFSWEITTTPVAIATKGFKPTATIEVVSTECDADKLAQLEAMIYGTDGENEGAGTEAKLPTPDEIITLIGAAE